MVESCLGEIVVYAKCAGTSVGPSVECHGSDVCTVDESCSVVFSYDTGKTGTFDVTSNKFGLYDLEEMWTTCMYVETGYCSSVLLLCLSSCSVVEAVTLYYENRDGLGHLCGSVGEVTLTSGWTMTSVDAHDVSGSCCRHKELRLYDETCCHSVV